MLNDTFVPVVPRVLVVHAAPVKSALYALINLMCAAGIVDSGRSTLEQGAQLHPQFLSLHPPPVWRGAIIIVTMNNISLLRCVDQNDFALELMMVTKFSRLKVS